MENRAENTRSEKISSDSWDFIDNSKSHIGKNKFPYYIGLFLISPILSLISAVTTFSNKGAKIILVLFMGVIGFTIIFVPGSDSESLAEDFTNHYQDMSANEFTDELISIVTLKGSGSTVDEPYMHFVAYTVAQFVNSSRWLFCLAGLIYGIFYLKGLTLVYSEAQGRWNLILILLFIYFFSLVSLDGINAPRTHTANWVFFTGAFLYFKKLAKKYILLVLIAPFVHLGFSAIIFPFFVYLFLGDRKYFYILLLVVSIFASAHMSFLGPILSSTEIGETKMQQYTGEHWDVRQERAANSNLSFHAEYYKKGSNLAIQFMLIASFFFAGYFKNNNHDHLQNALGGISILLLAASNFMSSAIPVLGSRLFLSFSIFALAYLIRLYALHYKELSSRRWIIYICVPPIFLFLFTKWSIIGNYLDFKVLFSPLFYPFLSDDPVSMKVFLKQLLGL